MLIKIEERPNEPPFVRYAAIVSYGTRKGAEEMTYIGSSPDEALGYAVRERLLTEGIEMSNGDLLLNVPLRVTLMKEEPADGRPG